MQKQIGYERWAAILIGLCAGLLLLRFFALPLLSAALPFLLSGLLVSLLSPLANNLSRRLGWNRGLCSTLLFFFLMAASLLLGGFALATLMREGRELFSTWLVDLSSPSSLISNAVDALRLPDGEKSELFRAQLKRMLTDFGKKALGEITGKMPTFAAKFAGKIPSAILFSVITVFSGVQFSINGDKILQKGIACLPEKWQPAFSQRQKRIQQFLQRYLRAYLVLFLISFAVLFVGFLFLRSDYAFFAAIFVALVDLLPFLGVGTVLLPWAVLELLCRNYFFGFGLLILCLIATVARQIAEPHLIGKTLGVHPLFSLAAGYAGWKLAGVAGLFAAPLLLPVLKWMIRPTKEKKKL